MSERASKRERERKGRSRYCEGGRGDGGGERLNRGIMLLGGGLLLQYCVESGGGVSVSHQRVKCYHANIRMCLHVRKL